MPSNFEVIGFQMWLPAIVNTHKPYMFFSFRDNLTTVVTNCTQDDGSQPEGPMNDEPRYRCKNPNVQYIFDNGDLTLIEQTCATDPGTPSGYEAGGTVTIDWNCYDTPPEFWLGKGLFCDAYDQVVTGNFTSFHPTPLPSLLVRNTPEEDCPPPYFPVYSPDDEQVQPR
ncbi:hypothetical protein QBC39DRAFT_255740 [Podospora conica]|nr:hypothetical protein QBC39DRAFT_255740 [Schizothecium conicum]